MLPAAPEELPWLSCSIEENVGLKPVPVTPEGAAGGFVSLPPKELEAVVDMNGPVAPSEAATPPGLSFSYLFK